MDILSVPQGDFQLSRFPQRKRETLRAWDAADEYLLNYLAEEKLLTASGRVLIVNDQFGALAVPLHGFQPVSISDSWLAHEGSRANYAHNQLDLTELSLFDSLNYPQEQFDLILLKVPKSLAMLEDQLTRLRPLLKKGGRIIASGMVKAIHTSTLKLFERLIGPTRTSLARKKARLIFPQLDEALNVPDSPYPSAYTLEDSDYQIYNHAAVFSREKLDIGTRFLLQHLPADDHYREIIDLGCGNGVVGLMCADKNPSAQITFTDESHMAVASAELNFTSAFGDNRTANFRVTDCLRGITTESADLIINNPPFHQQNTVGDFIALQMFRESYKVLRNNGELWVIGNRHLGYHVRLKKLFGNCETVASNKKFVILRARKKP